MRQIATTGDACVEVMYYNVHDETTLSGVVFTNPTLLQCEVGDECVGRQQGSASRQARKPRLDR